MANNEQIINLQDKLIKGYKKEIDLLKQQNALLRENREKSIHIRDSLIENYKKVNELLKEQNTLLKEKNALLSEMVERQNQVLEE